MLLDRHGTQSGPATFGAGTTGWGAGRRWILWWYWFTRNWKWRTEVLGYIGGVSSFKHSNGTTYTPNSSAGQNSGHGHATITFVTF